MKRFIELDNTPPLFKPNREQPAPKSRSLSSKGYTSSHLLIKDEADVDYLLEILSSSVSIKKLRVLTIFLNAERVNALGEDRLVRALERMHPSSDGTLPHSLDALEFIIQGRILFTRYSYQLISPAASFDVKGKLSKIVSSNLSSEEQASLAFSLWSTEKPFATALLGIRGVPQIVISGRGKLEAGFEATIRATIPQSPTDSIARVSSVSIGGPYATPDLDIEGQIDSATYDHLPWNNPYPVIGYKTRHKMGKDKDSVALDEQTLLLSHLIGADPKHAVPQAAISAGKQILPELTFDEDLGMFDDEVGQGRRTRLSRKQNIGGSRSRREHSQVRTASAFTTLGLHNIVRIRATKQDTEDLGLVKDAVAPAYAFSQKPRAGEIDDADAWLSLTGKGNLVEMGWII